MGGSTLKFYSWGKGQGLTCLGTGWGMPVWRWVGVGPPHLRGSRTCPTSERLDLPSAGGGGKDLPRLR